MVMEGLNKVCFVRTHADDSGRAGENEAVVKWLLNLIPNFRHWIIEILGDESSGMASNHKKVEYF